MRLSPILSRYITRQFVMALLATLMVVMGLILLFDMIELLRRAAGKPDTSFLLVLGLALMKLPQMVHMVLPFTVMIGAMVVFWRMTRSHELVVARSAGVSVWQFLMPVLTVAAVVGVAEITLLNPLSAALYARYERLQDELFSRSNNPLSLSEAGLWLRETQGEHQAVLHADDVRQEGLKLSMRTVTILLYSGPEQFSHRIDAKAGTLEGGHIDLEDGFVMQPGSPSQHFETYRLRTTLTLGRIQDNFASPETVSFWKLPAFIEFFESAGFSANKHRLYFQSLLASPILLCAMVLVAAAFSLRPNLRSGGLLGRVGAGVLAGFLLYFFSKIIYAFGQQAALPQALAAWSPALVTMMIGLAALFHLEDG